MKENKSFLLCCLFAIFIQIPVHAQNSYCTNLGFELGNFTNWVGYTWLYSTDEPQINTSPAPGFVSRRHSIISDNTAYDENTGYLLKKIPPGYEYSCRLGDEIISSDQSPRCWQQSLRYTMTIDSNNVLLIMKFALVLEYADDHSEITEPRFRLTLYDQNDVFASNSNIKGFHTYTPEPDPNDQHHEVDPVQWRDWTTVGANLMKYIGQTVTVEFMSTDCTKHYHYGYAYFVAACHPLCITIKYCAGDSIASLIAPEGFEQYSWTNSSGTIIDTMQTLDVTNPVEGETFSCKMTSATGCTVTLQSTIAKYIPKADFSSYMIDCNSNTVQLTNSSTSTHGSLLYSWDFGDGNTSFVKNPRYTFSTSGRHNVGLLLTNPPSTCVNFLTKEVESFSPPLVGIEGDSTYCAGLTYYIKAYGAYDYTWSNGSKVDSIEVGAPGGTYKLIGRSSNMVCSDTNYITVTEEPDWEFLAEGDTILCEGDSITISVSGAVTYYWNTGDTLNSIIIGTSGKYTGTGSNKRGCEKSKTFNVVEYPLPNVDFTTSPSTIDSKHNMLSCSMQAEPDVTYAWDMGDGATETGSTTEHEYNISNSTPDYLISLTATDKVGCENTASGYIDVIPFVPNVFSPNGDGINDVFMPDVDTEVFDRNGLSIYKGLGGWDGKYKGQIVDPDTYFYTVYYTDRNELKHTKKGYITVVK